MIFLKLLGILLTPIAKLISHMYLLEFGKISEHVHGLNIGRNLCWANSFVGWISIASYSVMLYYNKIGRYISQYLSEGLGIRYNFLLIEILVSFGFYRLIW